MNSGAGSPAATTPIRGLRALRLAAQAELADERAVALEVLLLQVVQEAAALADEHEQPTTGVVVVLVLAEVLGEVVDPPRQQRDLHLGGAGVVLALAKAGDDLLLLFGSQCGHVRRGTVAGAAWARSRPAALASYSAPSARRRRSSGASPAQVATPMDTVTAIGSPACATSALAASQRSFSITRSAAPASVSGSTTRNSSPPRRPRWSSARMCSASARATSTSTSSPVWCP